MLRLGRSSSSSYFSPEPILTVTVCRSLQPEALKSVVEDGRNRIPIIGRQVSQGPTVARKVTTKVFQNPFRLFPQPDILLLLALNAIVSPYFMA